MGGLARLPGYNGRDRNFWFATYEGGRRRLGSGPQTILVPTTRERAGDFSDWPYPTYNLATSGSVPATTNDPAGRATFPGNVIPTAQISLIGKNLLQYFPLPTTNCGAMPSCGNYTGEVTTPITTDVVDARAFRTQVAPH